MKRFLIFVLVVAMFLAGVYVWTHRRPKQQEPSFTPASGPAVDLGSVHVLAAIDEENTLLLERVLPSVVSITTTKQVQTGFLLDPYQFLQNHRIEIVGPDYKNLSALGSGVIVSKEGYILTNNHVVADMDKIQVQLNDGRIVPAEIKGVDPQTDIAVLKITADNLNPLLLGNSDDVKVGLAVFAVGNPLGLQETVTHGIISAKSRVLDLTSPEYFQTDAPINEGNSGGPLVNLRGEVIGINTRIASSQSPNSQQPQGLSFAIPSNVARFAMEEIIKHGHVERGYFGVGVDVVPPQLATQLGMNQVRGALVTGVAPGSPADQAGLKKGDVITKFNNREIDGLVDLRSRSEEALANTDVTLGIFHADGKAATLTLHIIPPPAPPVTMPTMLTGLKVVEISVPASPPQPPGPPNAIDELRARIPASVKGVIVTDIAPDSAIGKTPNSLQVGDVIEEINHAPVESVADYERISKQLVPGAQQVLFLVYRGNAHFYVVVTPK